MNKSFTVFGVVLIVLILHTGITLYLNSARPNQKIGPASVEVLASDNHYVLKVEFYIDNFLIAIDSARPYGFIWETLHY
jgi:hypothetical protein